jgi:hypothetical protein
LVALLAPAAAGAKQLTVTRGDVRATLTYSRDAATFGYKADGLKIVRGGQLLYDAIPHPASCQDLPCGPAVGFGTRLPPLRVRDLDADGEPEVIYAAYTGGAHCCVVGQVFALTADGSGYTSVDRNFGNPDFWIQDLNGDGRPEVVTADDAFAYRFTSYAFSGLPLSVLRYDHGSFTDITDSFPDRLRAEAKAFWREYKRLRTNRDGTERGQIAAWVADLYRLGKRKHALRILKREVRNGYLSGAGGGAKFIHTLHLFLLRRGYA